MSTTSQPAQEDANALHDKVTSNVRNAIRAALPTSNEQFMTIMAPGKVIHCDNYKVDKDNNECLSTRTELNQAILCDEMPSLSAIQTKSTGRSVARAYASAISTLVSSKSTIGNNPDAKQTKDQERYDQAMRILSNEQPHSNGKTLVELYMEKQAAYTQAITNMNKAFDEALQRAQKDPRNQGAAQVRLAYEAWLKQYSRAYEGNVKAAYMDWVVVGRKAEVEHWFLVVDHDSSLSRIEQSKEAMRLAVILDEDGATEYHRIRLVPADWANKCEAQMKKETSPIRTADWYAEKIAHLGHIREMLSVLETEQRKVYEDQETADTGGISDTQLLGVIDLFRDALLDEYTRESLSQGEFQEANDEHAKLVAFHVDDLDDGTKEELKRLLLAGLTLDEQMKSVQKLLDESKRQYALIVQAEADAARQDLAEELGIPEPIPDPAMSTPGSEYFTKITVESSASDDSEKSGSGTTTSSASNSTPQGSDRISASNPHAEVFKELMKCSVRISFECMRVDITRPWLRGELFSDPDLMPAPGITISPGSDALREMIEDPTIDPAGLDKYRLFAMYPVSFLVACNIVLEVSGRTSNLYEYMNSSSTSASAGLKFGPFTVGTSRSREVRSTCTLTESGCRIGIGSPQIIGWVSQMLPHLDRSA